MASKLMLTAAQTESKIASIRKRSSTLAYDIHETGVACLVHFEAHGDLTLLSNLHEAVSASYKASLKLWAAIFAPVRWDRKKQQFKKTKGKNAQPFNILGSAITSPDEVAHARHEESNEFLELQALKAVRAGLYKKLLHNIAKSTEAYDNALAAAIGDLDEAIAEVKKAA